MAPTSHGVVAAWKTDPLARGGSVLAPRLVQALLLCGAITAPAAAQTGGESTTAIVVTANRSLAIRPVRSVAGEDLSAYGAGSIRELLDEVVSENGDRDQAITILVDGKRVTGLGDIDTYPAEALARVDILPRESGALVGAPGGSRVYNIVLKPRARLAVARGRARAATDGGTTGGTINFSATQIRRPQRLNLALQLRRDGALLESERGVRQPENSPPGLGRARTLRPGTEGEELTFSAADRLTGWLDGLVTMKIGEERSRSLLGLNETNSEMRRDSRSRTVDLSAQLTAEVGSWQAVLDATARRERRRILTAGSSGAERTSTHSSLTNFDILVFGPLVDLGAGPVILSLGANFRHDRIRGRGSDGMSARFVRSSREARAGVDVPIVSQSGPLASLGALNFRAEFRHGRADGATVSGRSLSLRWAPAAWLDLSASENRSRTPPGIDLIGEPLIETAGVRFFDPVRAETIDLITVSGGIGSLPASNNRVRRLAADLRPVTGRNLLLSAEYTSTRAKNVLTGLPPASIDVVRFFADRFQRDADGRLTRVDLRPLVFPSMREQQLRFGTNLTLPLHRGGGAPRVQLSASYRLLLRSRLETGVMEGTVDLLSRSGINFAGMRPRHQFDASLGYSERGLGVRLTGERRSRTFLNVSGEAGVLRFDPLTTFSLRAFIEGSRLVPGSGFLAGSRLSLAVNNAGNGRERVRDERGMTPLAFQPALRNPVGRTVEIEFRKTF